MNLTPEATATENDSFARPMPVILPLSAAEPTADQPRPLRFAFPAIEESPETVPPASRPAVIWPRCDNAKKVRACAEAAGNILRLSPPDRTQWIALCSPRDGDGKTDLVIALAPELAKLTPGGVLAVDANFHKPDLTTRLNALAETAGGRPALILPTDLPGLSLLPALTFRKAQAWGFDPLKNRELRRGWSLALVDMPSLDHAEAVRFTQHCNGVILAVRMGRTSRRVVAEAAHAIRVAGGRLLACLALE